LFPPPSPSNDGGSSPGPPAAAAPPSGRADRGPAQTSGLYLVSLQVGTPPQDVSGILDISAQLVWMQCAACTDCVTPPSTIFQPVDSKTLQSVTCDSDVCKASLAQACDQQDNNPCGYVATYGDDDNSQVQLDGVVDVPRTTTAARRSRSTPLLAGSLYTDLYYVGLTGIHVGGEEVDGIPAGTFDLQDDGSGGVFLSTTVPVSYLLSGAYTAVRQAFASRISAQPIKREALAPLCYTAQSMVGVNVPRLTLVFKGEDATMELSEANYFFRFNDGDRDVECLTVLPSTDASVLGSLLQTGTTMIYDLDKGQLTFEYDASPARPGSESEAQAQASPSLATVVALAVWMVLLLF
jgi:hypothetical protein